MINSLQNNRQRRWLNLGWKVMVGWGILNIFFSILVPLTSLFISPKLFTFGIEDEKFVGMSWEQIVANPDMGLWMVLMMVSMCAMMIGLGILTVGISRNAYRRGERWAWRWLSAASVIVLLYNLSFVILYAQRGLYGMFTSAGPFPSGINVGIPFMIIWVIVLYVGLWLPRKELKSS